MQNEVIKRTVQQRQTTVHMQNPFKIMVFTNIKSHESNFLDLRKQLLEPMATNNLNMWQGLLEQHDQCYYSANHVIALVIECAWHHARCAHGTCLGGTCFGWSFNPLFLSVYLVREITYLYRLIIKGFERWKQ